MKNHRKGFTLIELLIVVVIVGILALAAIPLIQSNTRDARRAEGEQLLGSARDMARVEYSKANSTTDVNAELAAHSDELTGSYFVIATPLQGATTIDGTGYEDGVQATPNTTASGSADDGNGTMGFDWGSGASAIEWAEPAAT